MKMLTKLICLFLILWSTQSHAQTVKVASPNGNLVFNFKLVNKAAFYSVSFKGKTIIDYSSLSLDFDNGNFQNNLKLNKPTYKDTTEDYDLVVGKTSHVHTRYKEVTLPLEEALAPKRKINIVARVFNDGVAFRYVYPQQENWTNYSLLDENTTFKFVGDPTLHALFLPNYTTSHEGYYTVTTLSKAVPDSLMDMPALFELPGNVFVGITEAELVDYAGMYLTKHDGVLVSELSPLPKQPEIKVKEILPHRSPWRVMLISDKVGDLIESNIITTLNEPCAIKDVSWLRPGKTTFPWWNGDVVPDTINAPGNNFVTNKYYIDFCARNNIGYHSVVEYGLHQWYMDDGENFQPGPHADVTTPVPGLDMKEICDYAKSVGVGVRVWVHFYALYPKLDTAFAIFEKWGLQGMMVDFMDRDDQEMVNMQNEVLQKAAQHHLHIQFHGAYKPTGLSRTYPNEFTREGTLNYEADKWTDGGLPPGHDINMPFTRMLAGSTDYHLGGFRAVPPKDFTTPHYTRPLVLGTRCHMLGMYVVLENYLQMVCDDPTAYEAQPGFEFIKQIPTVWDETKVPLAKIDEYITIARRKNNDWYVGTISNDSAHTITIPMNFLEDGKYTATIYRDAKDTDTNPNNLIKEQKEITAKDNLEINLAKGGGCVMYLKKE